MKKIILTAITALLSLNLLCQVYWTKYPDNPVLTAGSPGEWDETRAIMPNVIYYDSTYHMWYSGNTTDAFRVGHATSPDGINWTRDPNNPVLDGGPEGTWDNPGILAGDVVVIDSIFHMWYTGGSDITYHAIGHATSPDGVNWIKDPNNPVLSEGPSGDWDDKWVLFGRVVYIDGAFEMWYSGWDGSSSPEIIRIGHATSPDGTNWIKDPQNPVMTPEGWDYSFFWTGGVVYNGSIYQMWYSGGKYQAEQIGYATSVDGSVWTKYENNPVLKKGPTLSWDNKMVGRCDVIFESTEHKYKMWYFGLSTAGTRNTGYAESDARLPALWVKNKMLVEATDTIYAEIHIDGIIYVVPEGTSPVSDSIDKYKLSYVKATANVEIQIPLADYSLGQYVVIAVSDSEFVSPDPFPFKVVPDANPPYLTIAEDTVRRADPILATSTKDGILYLLNTPVTPDLSLVRNPNFLIDSIAATADIQVEFPTVDLDVNKTYYLYAADIYGQFSERGDVRIEPGVGVEKRGNEGIRIYPNPANDLLTIETDEPMDCAFEITSLNGQLIFSTEMEGTAHKIDLSCFQEGIYLITIRNKDFITTRKIVKL